MPEITVASTMIMSLALRFVDGPDESVLGDEEGDDGKDGEDNFLLKDSISSLLMNYDLLLELFILLLV